MRSLKFKRYSVGQEFNHQTAERDTLHFVPVSIDPIVIKVYDVDQYGNVATVQTDNWGENKESIERTISNMNQRLTGATTEIAGVVKQMNTIQSSDGATLESVNNKLNELIQGLKNAGIME